MIRLIEFLISGCWHKWETIDECGLTSVFGNTGTRIMLKCEKCGNWKKKDLI